MVKEYLKVLCRKQGYHLVDPSDAEKVFACEVCRTEYDQKSEAEKCEARPSQEPAFKTGDKVKLINLDFIENKDTREENAKRLIGEIGMIIPHFEYYLEGDQHVIQYFVDFDKANINDTGDALALFSLGTRRIPEKSLEKVISD